MANDVLGEQAHFSTTQQLFSSLSDMKKQISYISKYISIFKNKHVFCEKPAKWLLQNGGIPIAGAASVPSDVRKCAVPPDYSCSKISFSRTCNIPNLISYIHRKALLPLETLHWLCVCIVAQLHAQLKKNICSVFSGREHWVQLRLTISHARRLSFSYQWIPSWGTVAKLARPSKCQSCFDVYANMALGASYCTTAPILLSPLGILLTSCP